MEDEPKQGEAWDRLFDVTLPVDEAPDMSSQTGNPEPFLPEQPKALAVLASAWADLVLVGGMTTATIAGVALFGYPISLPALPWACGVALAWWVVICLILVRVRRGTAGMLVAGITFGGQVAGFRTVVVLVAAAVSAVLLGFPLLVGRGLALTAAAGHPLMETHTDV